jgi:hypothetical protein
MTRMKPLVIVALVSLGVAACQETPLGPEAPSPTPAYGPSPPAAAFDARDFAWSQGAGPSSIAGVLAYRRDGVRYVCAGEDVLLIPETPWSRRRMVILYGSATAAALPASIVRARQPSAPTADFARFVRRTGCDTANHFVFQDLPNGSWFVVTIAKPQSGGGEPFALTRRVELQGGGRNVTLS